MKRTLFRVLMLAALALSLVPALSAPPVNHSPSEPPLLHFLGDFHQLLVAVNIWPFVFLQLLVCSLLPGLVGLLLLPGLAAAGLFGGFALASSQGAGGILIIIMTVVFFGMPLVGLLLGSAAWTVLLALQRLLG